MKKCILIFTLLSFFSCNKKTETTHPVRGSITESVYASGIVKSENQYQAFASANGILENIFVTEGDTVKKGQALLSISGEAQKLTKQNAELEARYADINSNQGKLNEAKLLLELAGNKMKNDSVLYFRQLNLWQQQVGSKVELEQRELSYENSKTAWYSSQVRYDDLKRQVDLASAQTKNKLLISDTQEHDYTLRSEIDGVVFSLLKEKGEMVTSQTPLAILGTPSHFILEMQVDEYDIVKIKPGMDVLVTMDTYKGNVFEGLVTKVYPYMNERSKTFKVEADFIHPPDRLFPNISFEANILLQKKENAILIPRAYLIGDSLVLKKGGDTAVVKTGLRDYLKVEIISGVTDADELQKPTE